MPAPFRVVDYQTTWPADYRLVEAQLRCLFGDHRVRIEHIGSTSVVGLCAKPVIDILLGAPDLSFAQAQVHALAQIGYRYRPEHEVELPERRYFVRQAQADSPRVNLHAVVKGGGLWRNHLAFRDALRATPKLAMAYGDLKRRLAQQHASDRAVYTKAKAPFVQQVLADTQIKLRPARPDDALCLSALAIQVFLDTYATEGVRPAIAREVLATYSQAAFERSLADTQTRWCIAERAGLLVAFAQVTLNTRQELVPASRPAELLRLYVQEPFTGIGLGGQLLAAAEDTARQEGADMLWLSPWVHNHRALGFYARQGYEDFGLTHFVFEGEAHENRVLAKRLSSRAPADRVCDGLGCAASIA